MHDIYDAETPMGDSVLSLHRLFGLAEAHVRCSSRAGSEGYVRSVLSGSVQTDG